MNRLSSVLMWSCSGVRANALEVHYACSTSIHWLQVCSGCILFIYLFRRLYLFLERREGRGRERERNINVRQKHWLPLELTRLRTKPATQACALTRNQTGDILLHSVAPNQLSHTSHCSGCILFFFIFLFFKLLYCSFTVVCISFSLKE